MKVQMVIVANAREERGRSLLGILLENGVPVVHQGRPHWLRPVVHRTKNSIPTPMVVDLLPRDIVELEVLDHQDLSASDGIVEADFYSLQIKGRMPLEQLVQCCHASQVWEVESWHEAAGCPALGRTICMVLACRCNVVSPLLGGDPVHTALEFGFNGFDFKFPIADPQLLEMVGANEHVLIPRASLQVVLMPTKLVRGKAPSHKVVAVLY